jgi:hypothetical protein
LHCIAPHFFSANFFGGAFLQNAIAFARGNLFAMRNGESMSRGADYQVLGI